MSRTQLDTFGLKRNRTKKKTIDAVNCLSNNVLLIINHLLMNMAPLPPTQRTQRTQKTLQRKTTAQIITPSPFLFLPK